MEKNSWQQLADVPQIAFHFGRDVIRPDGVRSFKIQTPDRGGAWYNADPEVKKLIEDTTDKIKKMSLDELEDATHILNGSDIVIDVVESARTGALKIVEESVHSV